jgi:hypothetical protein
MRLFGPYYYGEHKWDNYLLDIQEAIGSGNAVQQQSVRPQEEALDIAHEQVEELRQQTVHLHRIEEVLQSGFELLRSEFEWGFTLMAERMDRQIEELANIAAKLDAIHKTLLSPLLTQARDALAPSAETNS